MKQLRSSFFLACLLLISCNENKKLADRGGSIWIGCYQDIAYQYPLPLLYTNDSIFVMEDRQEAKPLQETTKVHNTDEHAMYLPSNENTTNHAYFKRARRTTLSIDPSFLTSQHWQTIEEEQHESFTKQRIYSFQQDSSLTIQTNYFLQQEMVYSEQEQYNYELVDFRGVHILFI